MIQYYIINDENRYEYKSLLGDRSPGGLELGITVDEEPAGVIAAFNDSSNFYISYIFIHEKYRGRNLAKELIGLMSEMSLKAGGKLCLFRTDRLSSLTRSFVGYGYHIIPLDVDTYTLKLGDIKRLPLKEPARSDRKYGVCSLEDVERAAYGDFQERINDHYFRYLKKHTEEWDTPPECFDDHYVKSYIKNELPVTKRKLYDKMLSSMLLEDGECVSCILVKGRRICLYHTGKETDGRANYRMFARTLGLMYERYGPKRPISIDAYNDETVRIFDTLTEHRLEKTGERYLLFKIL